MPRSIPLLVVAAAATVAAGAGLNGTSRAATTAPSTSNALEIHTLVYTLRASEAHMTYLGDDEDHPKAGDRIVEHSPLYRNGKRDGHMINVCTVVITSGEGDVMCEQSLETREGQLVLAGSGNPRVVPITGGSGEFAFATGQVTQRPTKSGGKFVVRYTQAR